MFTTNEPVIQTIERQIEEKRKDLARLEQAKSLLVASEPGVTAVRSKRGNRPTLTTKRTAKRGMRANSNADVSVKRGPGRPKGSKNKPKDIQAPVAPAAEQPSTTPNSTEWSSGS